MGVCETTPTTFEPTGTPDTATPTEPTPTTKQSQPGSTTNHATGPAPHAPKPALDNQDPHGCRWPAGFNSGSGSALPRKSALELLWGLHAQRELGLARLVDLGVEDLVLKVGGGLRLEKYLCPGRLEHLIVLRWTGYRGELQLLRAGRFVDRGVDPQARTLRRHRGRCKSFDDLGGRLGQHQHACYLQCLARMKA